MEEKKENLFNIEKIIILLITFNDYKQKIITKNAQREILLEEKKTLLEEKKKLKKDQKEIEEEQKEIEEEQKEIEEEQKIFVMFNNLNLDTELNSLVNNITKELKNNEEDKTKEIEKIEFNYKYILINILKYNELNKKTELSKEDIEAAKAVEAAAKAKKDLESELKTSADYINMNALMAQIDCVEHEIALNIKSNKINIDKIDKISTRITEALKLKISPTDKVKLERKEILYTVYRLYIEYEEKMNKINEKFKKTKDNTKKTIDNTKETIDNTYNFKKYSDLELEEKKLIMIYIINNDKEKLQDIIKILFKNLSSNIELNAIKYMVEIILNIKIIKKYENIEKINSNRLNDPLLKDSNSIKKNGFIIDINKIIKKIEFLYLIYKDLNKDDFDMIKNIKINLPDDLNQLIEIYNMLNIKINNDLVIIRTYFNFKIDYKL